MKFALSDVSDVVVLEIEDTLSMLDDGGGIGRDEEFDGLGKTILGHESTGLSAENFRGSSRHGEQIAWS